MLLSRHCAEKCADLCRTLRAVHLASHHGSAPERFLDIVDSRTLSHLVSLSGFGSTGVLPASLHTFVLKQRLMTDEDVISELHCILSDASDGLGDGRT